MQLPDKQFLSVKEVARLFGFSLSFTYQACQKGEIPSFKIGNKICVSTEALRSFVEQKQVASA